AVSNAAPARTALIFFTLAFYPTADPLLHRRRDQLTLSSWVTTPSGERGASPWFGPRSFGDRCDRSLGHGDEPFLGIRGALVQPRVDLAPAHRLAAGGDRGFRLGDQVVTGGGLGVVDLVLDGQRVALQSEPA